MPQLRWRSNRKNRILFQRLKGADRKEGFLKQALIHGLLEVHIALDQAFGFEDLQVLLKARQM